LFIVALEAEAASQPIFFPTLETEASKRKDPGKKGVRTSRSVEAWIETAAQNRNLYCANFSV
jgi:hypothetical protein